MSSVILLILNEDAMSMLKSFLVLFSGNVSYQTLKNLRSVQAFFKEFRVVGQIRLEDMDESGILPKARYAITAFHCLE